MRISTIRVILLFTPIVNTSHGMMLPQGLSKIEMAKKSEDKQREEAPLLSQPDDGAVYIGCYCCVPESVGIQSSQCFLCKFFCCTKADRLLLRALAQNNQNNKAVVNR